MDQPTRDTPEPFDREYAEGCQLFEAGQLEAAIAAFARAAAWRPDDFRPFEMTACCLGGLACWEECLQAFERARQLGHECS